ncbi:hypothetical protein [Arthrobacter sp. OV608]|uniref:hypothetical protein n=1 Tax=Arthrobacter sp. OV608 TaxID=1882768 RepID=UPI0008BA6059|nr:hypothetical protein [Arthrobacter sp. OV608]SEQ79520.1 hypothetical protein SAMN05444745_11131 [Arthrobacter sp. OV608]
MLADAAQARVGADLEAVRIVEAYSRHELLRHLPVPRFRLPEVTVDLPFLISTVEGIADKRDGRSISEPTAAEITKAVDEGLSGSDIRLPRAEVAKVSKAVAQGAKALFGGGSPFLLSPAQLSGELTVVAVQTVTASMRGDPTPEQLQALETAMKASLTALMATKLVISPSLQVIVTSGEIKEHANSESIVRVRLTITEDAYEAITRDDRQGYYLTPE